MGDGFNKPSRLRFGLELVTGFLTPSLDEAPIHFKRRARLGVGVASSLKVGERDKVSDIMSPAFVRIFSIAKDDVRISLNESQDARLQTAFRGIPGEIISS